MDMSKGLVTMYVSAFGNEDAHGDIIQQGAFAKTIQENAKRIKHLWQHDSRNPIGTPQTMIEDTYGLLVQSFVSDIKDGDYRRLYEDEVITEHSIGFIPIIEEYNSEDNINTIKEVKLFEYSSVTWGANENTPVVSMKGLTNQEKGVKLFERLNRLTKAVKDGRYTDETFLLLELEIEQIKSSINTLIVNEPPKEALDDFEPLVKMNLNQIFTNQLNKTR